MLGVRRRERREEAGEDGKVEDARGEVKEKLREIHDIKARHPKLVFVSSVSPGAA